jgi:hypothetical protein
MARQSLDEDLAKLKEKLAAKGGAGAAGTPDRAARSLRKRLKRGQRKRRRLIIRKQNASGKKKGEGAAPAASA